MALFQYHAPLGQDDFVGEPNRSALQLRFTASPRETLAPRGHSLYNGRLLKHNRLSHLPRLRAREDIAYSNGSPIV